MKQKLKSEGKCLFCNKVYSKAAINRHLATHLAQKAEENKSGISYAVKVEAGSYYHPETSYFLSLWVDGDTTFGELDWFLKSIWLECCGHLSSFKKPGQNLKRDFSAIFKSIQSRFEQTDDDDFDDDFDDDPFAIPMDDKVASAFHQKQKIKYEYDFGSTTELTLTVTSEYNVKADDGIVLLSRNEPLEIYCDSCHKNIATCLCTIHGPDEQFIFCNKCAKKHAKDCPDFEDYAAMPIVNSPRFGVCAYEGGTIDVERDGIYGQ